MAVVCTNRVECVHTRIPSSRAGTYVSVRFVYSVDTAWIPIPRSAYHSLVKELLGGPTITSSTQLNA